MKERLKGTWNPAEAKHWEVVHRHLVMHVKAYKEYAQSQDVARALESIPVYPIAPGVHVLENDCLLDTGELPNAPEGDGLYILKDGKQFESVYVYYVDDFSEDPFVLLDGKTLLSAPAIIVEQLLFTVLFRRFQAKGYNDETADLMAEWVLLALLRRMDKYIFGSLIEARVQHRLEIDFFDVEDLPVEELPNLNDPFASLPEYRRAAERHLEAAGILATPYETAAFANAVARLMTGLPRAANGPSVREQVAVEHYAGKGCNFMELCLEFLDEKGPIFGPLTEEHLAYWNAHWAHCENDDPADIKALLKMCGNR